MSEDSSRDQRERAEDDTTPREPQGGVRPRRRGLWIALILAALLAAGIVVRAFQAAQPAPEDPTVDELRAQRGIPVVVTTAEVGPMESWERYHGTVSGAQEAVVRARTDHAIARVPASVGDQVRRGQILVQLSGEEIEARRRQAEAAYRQATRRMERLEPLHEEGAISDQEWEDAVTAYEIAQGDLAAARETLALESPLSGTVTAVTARPGMVPSPGDPLVRVADLSRPIVRLDVSAPAARAIDTDQPARLRNRAAEGSVSSIALHADPATRLVEVEIAFPPDAPLFPGTLETVEIRIHARDDALRVPRAAVRDDAVWIVTDDRVAERRPVSTGVRDGEDVEIVEGIAEGDRVVVEGASALEAGARVRIVEETNEPA